MIEDIAPVLIARRIAHGPTQMLDVVVTSPHVGRLSDATSIYTLGDPEEQAIDPVALFAKAAARHFFTSDPRLQPTVDLAVTANEADQRRWRLDTAWVDHSAFRILSNLLAAVPEANAEFRPAAAAPSVLDVDNIAYPAVLTSAPFPYHYEAPLKSTQDRLVRVEFAQGLSDAQADRVLRDLELWSNLLIHGGYRDRRSDPTGGAFAQQPVLEGRSTIGLAIPIVRDCDEAMFNPLVTYLAAVHATTAPIEALTIE